MTKSVKLEGFKELDAVLKRDFKKATARSVLRRALLAAAEPMAAKARALAPDDPETIDLDRDLRESITVGTKAKNADVGKAAFAKVMRAGGSRAEAGAALRAAMKGRAGVVAYVGPTKQARHGGFQEFGTVNHAPQAFMRPAFDAEANPTIKRLAADLAHEINVAAARAAAKTKRST